MFAPGATLLLSGSTAAVSATLGKSAIRAKERWRSSPPPPAIGNA